MSSERVVHLDGDHPTSSKPSFPGHSIGHWEGATLVVDTLGFTAQPEGYWFDVPSSTAKHITERFTVSDDRAHLDYEITVEDALYLAKPVTHRSRWSYRTNQTPTGVPCDLEVARRFTTNE